MGFGLPFQTEAKLYVQYILQTKPNAKIAILYQNDDMGKDYLKGIHDELGDKATKMIVAEVTYEATDPTVDSQIVTLKGSGADTFISLTTPKSSAQAIRKAYDIGWKPLYITSVAGNSVETVLKPAGTEKAIGIVSVNSAKDPTDPQWKDDVAVKDYLEWMKKYYPEGNFTEIFNVYGYNSAQLLVQVLKQCGDDLSRVNVMRQAANIKNLQLPMATPGVKINTSPTDFFPIEQSQLMRFDGKEWVRFGEIMGK